MSEHNSADTTTGRVTEANSSYTIAGSHTYLDESFQQPGHTFAVRVQVTDGTNSATISTGKSTNKN